MPIIRPTGPATTATATDGYYWERRRREAAVPILVGVLGLAALGLAQQFPVRRHVESELVSRSRAGLRTARLGGVTVAFTGRDGILTGTVSSRANADRATAIVRRVDGVRLVDVRLAYPADRGAGSGPSRAATGSPAATSGPPATTIPVPATAVATPQTPATPRGAAPATTSRGSAGSTVRAALIGLPELTFSTGSARLTPHSRSVTSSAATALRQTSGARVELRGYTDDVGDWDVNLALSRARAEAVRRALIADGVPAADLISRGFSEQQPRVRNDSSAHRAMNRRVEFAVLP
jgi:outer membrane protein OmpA-like peptidoglycan-associated protein